MESKIETLIVYVRINKYADDGFSYYIVKEKDWEWINRENDCVKMQTLELPHPADEWLAQAGIDFVTKNIEAARKQMLEEVKRLKDFESKFLLLGCE